MLAHQQFYDPDCLHGIQLLQNKGRHRGFGVIVATQRPQILNKTVLQASGTLIAMQTIGDDALKVVKSWLGGSASKDVIQDVLIQLPALKTREAFVYSPQTLGLTPVRIKFNSFQTFDSMKTPKIGEARQQPKSVADIDLSAVTRDMAETIEKAKAEDPKILQSQIAGLRRDLERAQKTIPQAVAQVATKEVVKEVPVFPVVVAQRMVRQLDIIQDGLSKVFAITDGMMGNINNLRNEINAAPKNLPAPTKTVPMRIPDKIPVIRETPKAASSQLNGDQTLSKAEKLILQAFYWTKDEGSTPAKIGFYSNYSHKSGGFANTLSSLRSKGLLSGRQITSEGASLAASYAEAKPRGYELRKWLRLKLSKCENEILDVLIAHPGERFSKETIASLTESQYSSGSGGFANALARLRSLEAVEGYGSEGVKAAAVFFE